MSHRLLVIAALSTAALFAQPDPPARVARLSHVDGTISFQPAGVDDWTPAALNRPLTIGDRLWADEGSRAELQMGSASLHLASRTAFQFLNLDDRSVQVKLTEGTLTVHLRTMDPDESFEVDTPNLAFTLLRPGDYRIDADPDQQSTVVTVRQGQGDVTATGQAFSVRPGDQATITGDDRPSYDILQAPEPDGWDRWCMDRTQREDRAVSARYVSRDVIGYEDLDDYGSWSTEAEYGAVWYPRTVPVGWAPYRFGHWAWIEPWGWTWVDEAPWGFAPFHYGRWAYVGRSWGWIPGPGAMMSARPYGRPVYSPALVAWVGGANWGVSLSAGGGAPVGWVPLGPREVYVPSYRASQAYFTRVNTTNTVINNINITNVYNNRNSTRITYVNQSAPNGVTAVSSGMMASSRSVNQVATTVTAEQMRSAQVLGSAPVSPRRESLLGGGRSGVPIAAPRPPDGAFRREVVARSAPPPAAVPFTQRQPMLQQNPGRPAEAAPAPVRQTGVRVVTAQPEVIRPRQEDRQMPQRANPNPAPVARPEAQPQTRPQYQPQTRPQVQPQSRPAPVYRNESGERAPNRSQSRPAERKPEQRERKDH
ncbi:MAG: DUF6600 domain-containing protein [Bryobacteraceae bacterium]